MKAFEIIMTCILGACVLYIMWCMHSASMYLRKHHKEFDSPKSNHTNDNNNQ